MAETLEILLKISLMIFMVGNLFDMGLKLDLREALNGLRNVRFVVQSLLWGFVLCPALAYGLTKIIPLEPHYAIGMILLGMAPCAPFLPAMAEKARGDLAYVAAFMLLASVVTVVYMPLFVPVMVDGLTTDAWTIAKPLLFFLMVPLAIGLAILRFAPSAAAKLEPIVKKTTGIVTLLMLALCMIVYAKASWARGKSRDGTQIVSCHRDGGLILSLGPPANQKSPLAGIARGSWGRVWRWCIQKLTSVPCHVHRLRCSNRRSRPARWLVRSLPTENPVRSTENSNN